MRRFFFILLLGLFSGCAGPPNRAPPDELSLAPTTRPTRTGAPTRTPGPSLTPRPTRPRIPTLTPIPTRTPAPTITPNISGLTAFRVPIEGLNCFSTPQCSDYRIYHFEWQSNNQLVYGYVQGVLPAASPQPLEWYRYNLPNQLTQAISSPIPFSASIWAGLDSSSGGPYPHLDGLVSPSGQRLLYSTGFGGPYNPTEQVSIWLLDQEYNQPSKLLEFSAGSLYQAAWFEGERYVIFEFGYEGPGLRTGGEG